MHHPFKRNGSMLTHLQREIGAWLIEEGGDAWENSEMQNSSTQLPTIVKKQKALMSQKMSR
jgi:hypothetical protein